MLTPWMHPNLAQIARIWVAKTILANAFDSTPFSCLNTNQPSPTTISTSTYTPSDLISWDTSPTITTPRPANNTVKPTSRHTPLCRGQQPINTFLTITNANQTMPSPQLTAQSPLNPMSALQQWQKTCGAPTTSILTNGLLRLANCHQLRLTGTAMKEHLNPLTVRSV